MKTRQAKKNMAHAAHNLSISPYNRNGAEIERYDVACMAYGHCAGVDALKAYKRVLIDTNPITRRLGWSALPLAMILA